MHVETLIDLHNFNYSRSEASTNLRLPARQIVLFSNLQLPVGAVQMIF